MIGFFFFSLPELPAKQTLASENSNPMAGHCRVRVGLRYGKQFGRDSREPTVPTNSGSYYGGGPHNSTFVGDYGNSWYQNLPGRLLCLELVPEKNAHLKCLSGRGTPFSQLPSLGKQPRRLDQRSSSLLLVFGHHPSTGDSRPQQEPLLSTISWPAMLASHWELASCFKSKAPRISQAYF